jgi:hypothetical protein
LPSKLQDCSKNGSVEGGFQGPRRIVGESIAKTMKIYTGWGRLKYLHQMLQYVRVEAYKFRTIQVVSEQIAPFFYNHIIIQVRERRFKMNFAQCDFGICA